MAAFGVPVRDHEIQQWIRDSDKNWTRKLGKGWVGKRFLGKGQFGIVGLWEYQGPPQMAPEITQVVVKQVCLDMAHIEPPWGEMTGLSEGTILQKLSKVNTRHIIKMYGGNKLGDRFGEMSVVVKMFLEFCPGGDLEQLLVGWDEDYAPMRRKHVYDESDIWTIFYCLALGIAAMDRGTENSMEPAWFGEGERPLPPDQQTEICHFDIKPDNILFQYRDADHSRFPVLKIADFGEACEVKARNWQDDDYGGEFTLRGNQEMQAPEQTMNWKLNAFKDYPLRHPRKGTCSNIFQIGCVMNCLLLGQKRHFNIDDTTLHKSKLNDDLRGQWHHAIDLETRFISELYSSDLRALVTECLLRESLNRPSSVELVNRCQAGKAAADKVSRDTNRPHGHIPEKLKTMRLIPLKPPEPPEDWLNDINHFESDIDEQTWRNYTTLPQARISSPTIFRKAAGELVRVASSLTSINSPPATPSKSLFRQGLGTFRRGLQSPPSSLSNPADADGPDDGEFLDITKDETSPPDS